MERREGLEKRPTRELIARFVAQVGELLRCELQLARSELGSKVRSVAVAGLCLATALACIALGGLALVTLTIALLAIVLPVWAAALIAAGGFFALAAILALAARSFIVGAAPLLPERTIESLKEDFTWAKARVRSSNG